MPHLRNLAWVIFKKKTPKLLTLDCLPCQISSYDWNFNFKIKKGYLETDIPSKNKKNTDIGKKFKERLAYESVDGRSPSWITSQKSIGNKIKAVNG